MEEHNAKHGVHRKEKIFTTPMLILISIAVLLILFNQFQINSVSGMIANSGSRSFGSLSGEKDLSNIDVNSLKSTAHSVAAVFPLGDIQTAEDAMAVMFPIGTPDYGADLGVSYDEPVESLATLSRMYPGLRLEVSQNNPEEWQRFMSLASKPLGISCEYCCGLGNIGIDKQGNSACGCQHNPALLSIALYLSAYSDYSDGEILREVMKWKTLFFPKNMIELGMSVAGKDTSALDSLPGMVGGC